ncbi:hypothetical protein Tco_0278078 [Tanacetum coccineum]
MRRTLMIILVFTLCEEQVIWNSVLMRLIDDLLASRLICAVGFSDRRIEAELHPFISTNLDTFQLVDKPDEEPAHSEPEPEPEQEGAGEEYDMERAIQMSIESFQAQGHAYVRGVAIQEPVVEAIRPLPVVEGKGKVIVTEEQAVQSPLALHTPKRRSTTNQFIFQMWTPNTKEATTGPSAQPQDDTSTNIVCDSPSPADAETGEDVEKQVYLEEKTTELDQDQAGSDPGETHEGSSKLNRALSSMKNLEDAYAIRDQFINDKSTDDEPRKLNMEAEVVSMVTVPIYQASSSIPLLSTPVIDLLPKHASSTTQTPIFTATKTTTAPLPHPPQ